MVGFAASAAYHLSGPERPGIVIALHGLTGTFAQPLDLLDGFDSPNFGVLAPDLRAHGETSFDGQPEGFTPQQLASDVVELVEGLGLRSHRIRLVGISLGATVALVLLRESDLDIDAAVFVRPAHDAGHPDNLSANHVIAGLLRDDPLTALERLVQTNEYARVAAISTSAADGLRAKITKPRSTERVMRLERGSDWRAFDGQQVVETKSPTLIVAAPEDPLHPIAVAESWHRRIAGSTLAFLAPRDDDPAEQTRENRRLVQEFLNSVPFERRATS